MGTIIGTSIGIGAPTDTKMTDMKYRNMVKDLPVISVHDLRSPLCFVSFDTIPLKFANQLKFVNQSKKKVATEKIDKPVIQKLTLDLVKFFEGFYSKTYNDGFGNITIGYGFTKHTLPGLKWGDTISQSESDEYLYKVLKKREQFIYENIKVPITQEQFDALISWIYNIGRSAAKRSTLIKKINNGEYESAAKEFLRWNHVRGRQVKGLTIRRTKEKILFTQGICEARNLYNIIYNTE